MHMSRASYSIEHSFRLAVGFCAFGDMGQGLVLRYFVMRRAASG